ncbi:hypothetical protein SISSUDRAFT_1051550 [Sistotremastrum suecicum HHB10207 ss-3]|uniref:Protein kinase domain-containing protein n=2 Tax=Sistotremastraceae TaxID=3402574 RepID=A0A166AHF8_9AGAM|nr:hypothetical protein SISSUDRAFT_1051550 [Sistotremastrum suecicum HHB10207 ss-3]
MKQFRSRKPFSNQYLASLTVALQIAREAAQSVPIAGNALSGPVGVVLKILDIVDCVRSNREACVELTSRAGTLVLLLEEELKHESSITEDMQGKIENLQIVLIDLQRVVTEHTRRSWIEQSIHDASMKADLRRCETRLNDACQNFGLQTSLSIHRDMSALSRKQETLLEIASATNNMMESAKTYDRHFRLYQWDDVRLTGEISSRTVETSRISLYSAQIHKRRVVVRQYEPAATHNNTPRDTRFLDAQFAEELERLSQFRHPHIAQILGYVKGSDSQRFMVLEAGSISVAKYLRRLDPATRVIERFRLGFEMTCAHDFLMRRNISWQGCRDEILMNENSRQLYIGALGYFDGRIELRQNRVRNNFEQMLLDNDNLTLFREDFPIQASAFKELADALGDWKYYGSRIRDIDSLFISWLHVRSSSWMESDISSSTAMTPYSVGYLDSREWRPINLRRGFEERYRPWSSRFYYILPDTSRIIRTAEMSGYTRWSFPVRTDERIQIRAEWERHQDPEIMKDWVFRLHGISRAAGVPASDIRMVTEIGTTCEASIYIPSTTSNLPRTIYFFAYPLTYEGDQLNPWGYWSFESEPRQPFFEDPIIAQLNCTVYRDVRPLIRFHQFTEDECALLQALEEKGAIPRYDVELAGPLISGAFISSEEDVVEELVVHPSPESWTIEELVEPKFTDDAEEEEEEEEEGQDS